MNEPQLNQKQNLSQAEDIPSLEEDQSDKQSIPQKNNENWWLLSLVFILIGGIGFFGIKYFQLKQEVTNQMVPAIDQQETESDRVSPIPSSSSAAMPTVEWLTYENPSLGFSIQYPKSLKLMAIEADPKAEYKEYKRKCDSGEFEGCGGSRYPDFRIDFKIDNEITLFSIVVYQFPVKDYGLGEIVKDNFTYGIRINDPELKKLTKKEQLAIENIIDNIELIVPTKSLSCLWSPELGPGFDPTVDAKRIEENKKDLSLLSGIYFSENSNECKSTSFYMWNDELENTTPPFKELQECISTCIN